MKQHLTLLLISLLALSCTQENEPQTKAAAKLVHTEQTPVQVASQQPSEEDQEQLTRKCEEYWKEWEKLNAAKAGYFEKNILAKALANPDLPEENRLFLLDLKAHLRQTGTEKSKLLTPEQLLFPVFKLKEQELGIFGFPAYDTASPMLTDISAEHKLIADHRKNTNVDPHAQTQVVYYKDLPDSLFTDHSKPVYTFTTQKTITSHITNFGSYDGECLEYYHYLLDQQPFVASDQVLFGSKYKLDLTYKNNPAIDTLIVNQNQPQCADCPESTAHTKTFAELKGVDGLYFAYADTFPLNNKLETPSRALVMRMGDRMVYLWYKEVDLFGCSCM